MFGPTGQTPHGMLLDARSDQFRHGRSLRHRTDHRESRQLFTNLSASTAEKMSEEILVQRFFSAKRVPLHCLA